MELLIVSPPRSGNHWIRCLLASVYDLRVTGGGRKNAHPGRRTKRRDARSALAAALPQQEGDGILAVAGQTLESPGEGRRTRQDRGLIMHRHSRFQRRAVAELEARGVHIVTIVRDPYDSFLSYYRWVQSRKRADGDLGDGGGEARPRELMFGKPIDHPDVLQFLAEGFGTNLKRANQWLHSGHAAVIRYEDLHADPHAALLGLTAQIEPVSPIRIAEALDSCTIGQMLNSRPGMAHTLGTGKVGSSQVALLPCHLEIMREHWGDQIDSLGYPVR
jgi:hypothetical protein